MRVILRYLDKATIFINFEVHKVHADDASHIVVFMRLRQPFALLVRLGSFEHLGRNLAHVVVCVRVGLSEALGYEPARPEDSLKFHHNELQGHEADEQE